MPNKFASNFFFTIIRMLLTSGESDASVALGELYIEETDDGMNIVLLLTLQNKLTLKVTLPNLRTTQQTYPKRTKCICYIITK